LKVELREWCRLRRTTLVMAVLSAYVAFVLRWCNAWEGVFQSPIDSRGDSGIENTIGFFASMLYLRVGLLQDDSFIDLLNRVTQEYCSVYGYADPHEMSAQVPAPEFTRSPMFNWVPTGLSRGDLSAGGDSAEVIRYCPVPFEHPMARNLQEDGEPMVLLYDTAEGDISGDVWFPLKRFSVDLMRRFGDNLLLFVEALLTQPEGRVKDVSLL
jgi:hypothetical protein